MTTIQPTPKAKSCPLTDRQRKLVRENLGLVSVHLRRYVRNLLLPRWGREWADLFQEGCLGLIRAARTFQAESGIPFAAYALPRIHRAVSRAIQFGLAEYGLLPLRSARNRGTGNDSADEPRRIRLHSLPERVTELFAEPTSEADDLETSGCPRVGERLREKYERALHHAGRAAAGRSRRGDRESLVRTLIEERLLIPDDESKLPLREIARRTKSSFARVAQCQKRLTRFVREELERDPEFVELTRCARMHPHGVELAIDQTLEQHFASTAAAAFVRSFREADPSIRARMLSRLTLEADSELEEIVRHRVSRLDPRSREQLLRDTSPVRSRSRKTDPRPRPSTRRRRRDPSSSPGRD